MFSREDRQEGEEAWRVIVRVLPGDGARRAGEVYRSRENGLGGATLILVGAREILHLHAA
jgi:hypothetical protein